MKVTVTQEHIDKGCRKNGSACPVFLAMRDAGIPVTHVMTWCWTTHPEGACIDGWRRDLPYEAMAFIALFDDKKLVSPIEFELEWSEIES